jgi:phage/conjugal plasmid C-4 type zinc finger TraR family protein
MTLAMSKGFRDADFAQVISDRATKGEIERMLERDREQAAHAKARDAEGRRELCEDCNREIGAERLKALPAATRCVSCQAVWEQAAR